MNRSISCRTVSRGAWPFSLVGFLVLVVLLAGTASAIIDSGELHDPTPDYAKMRTYAFAQDPEEALLPGGAPSSTSPFIERQVQREVRYELARRGYDQASLADADFLVSISTGAQTTTWYSVLHTIYREPYESYFTAWGTTAPIQLHTYQDGTIILDVIDGKTQKLVWHGWATDSISPSKTTEELIKKLVKSILDRFPPKSQTP